MTWMVYAVCRMALVTGLGCLVAVRGFGMETANVLPKMIVAALAVEVVHATLRALGVLR